MPFADNISPAPREVRVAGAITALPGVALLVLAVLLLANSGNSSVPRNNIWAEAGFYVVLGAGTLACAAGLLLGKLWARSPGVVVALILVGVGWYVLGPSGQVAFGVPLIVLGLGTLVLLFRRPSRAWALGMTDGETEEEAAERDGAAGRSARRTQQDPGPHD
ncbi:hypothetical protein [Amycolatopsis anabasis]|uniref:hypothetical protein n=1 Tax=Amycolatopsis anabasis TaxID=1840409 RepID=UPI00131E58CF|nr:hypothetical protein [Amycolatopsis anabasis]